MIPRSKLKSYGDRAFSVSTPKLSNDIPETIKCSVDHKCNLKLIFLSVILVNDYVFKHNQGEKLKLIIIKIIITFHLDCKAP